MISMGSNPIESTQNTTTRYRGGAQTISHNGLRISGERSSVISADNQRVGVVAGN